MVGFVQGWLREGLRPRAITRDLDWGVPIPLEGFEDKRIYVWFDAVIGYLSASMEWAERQATRTPGSGGGSWTRRKRSRPLLLLRGQGQHAVPRHHLAGHVDGLRRSRPSVRCAGERVLTLDGQKLSSSRTYTSRLPFLPEALDLFDADAIRFFLTINAPESRDTDFSWDEFQRRNNDELVATYGNAVHRLLSFTQSRFGGVAPEPGSLAPQDEAMLERARATFETVGELIEAVRLRDGLLR